MGISNIASQQAKLLSKFFGLMAVIAMAFLFVAPQKVFAQQYYVGIGLASHSFDWGSFDIEGDVYDNDDYFETSYLSLPLIAGVEFDSQTNKNRAFAVELQFHSMRGEKTNNNAFPGYVWSSTGEPFKTETTTKISLRMLEFQWRFKLEKDLQFMLMLGDAKLDVEETYKFSGGTRGESALLSDKNEGSDSTLYFGLGFKKDIDEASSWRFALRSARWELYPEETVEDNRYAGAVILGVSYTYRFGGNRRSETEPASSSGDGG